MGEGGQPLHRPLPAGILVPAEPSLSRHGITAADLAAGNSDTIYTPADIQSEFFAFTTDVVGAGWLVWGRLLRGVEARERGGRTFSGATPLPRMPDAPGFWGAATPPPSLVPCKEGSGTQNSMPKHSPKHACA